MRPGGKTFVALAAVLAATLAACTSDGDGGRGAKNPNAARIDGFMFKPATLTVRAGTTVTWTNTDDIAHTITAGTPGAATGAFDSGDRTLSQTFSHEFGSPGSFAYFCRNHTSMTAEVTVT